MRGRLDQNPLRAFDADHEGTQRVVAAAPKLLERLAPEDREHFDAVLALLDAAGLPYEVDPTLVRGLDYYTRTVFEFRASGWAPRRRWAAAAATTAWSSSSAARRRPGVGWAPGVERMLLAARPRPRARRGRVRRRRHPDAARDAFLLAERLRAAGLRAEMEQAGRSMKGQLKQADRVGARATP